MASFIPFNPTPTQAFNFQATLDNAVYNLSCPWSVAGRRFYLQCLDQSATLIFYQPLIGSPDTGNINLLAGYFIASTLVYRVSTNNFEIGP